LGKAGGRPDVGLPQCTGRLLGRVVLFPRESRKNEDVPTQATAMPSGVIKIRPENVVKIPEGVGERDALPLPIQS
jgi:hypothetical protein